jgi:hypothetical protein
VTVEGAESAIVLLPRFTTLIGEGEFTTLPLDVSRFGSAQFQVALAGARVLGENPPFSVLLYLEESLDAEDWSLGPSEAQPHALVGRKLFSYAFRLRWFRLRLAVTGSGPMVTCWAEGVLR